MRNQASPEALQALWSPDDSLLQFPQRDGVFLLNLQTAKSSNLSKLSKHESLTSSVHFANGRQTGKS